MINRFINLLKSIISNESIEKSSSWAWNTLLCVGLVYFIPLVACCTLSSALNPSWTISINFITTSVLQIRSLRASYAFSLVSIKSNTQGLVTHLLNALTFLNCKSFNASCTLPFRVGSSTILRYFLTSCIDIEVVTSKTVNTDSLFSVTLTVNVNCFITRRGRAYCSIILGVIRGRLFRTWSVDRFIGLVSIPFLTIYTVALIIPFGTMFHNFNTNVLPFGTTFKTLKTSSCGFIKVFAVYLKSWSFMF